MKVKADLAEKCDSGYALSMYMREYFIVFPEGDTQEIQGRLMLNQLVDINGNPLDLPLPTNRMLVFQVMKIKTNEYKGGAETFHFLEQISAQELMEHVG